MNAVILALNSKYIHSSLAPWYLLAGVEAYGDGRASASVVEGTVNEPLAVILARVLAQEPDAVGMSCYLWNITKMQELAKLLRAARPYVAIVMGGPEVSYCAKRVLQENPAVDFILSGEGELPFARLLHVLTDGGDIAAVPGLSYRTSDGGCYIASPYVSETEPPSPYTDAYFAALGGRIAYLETSRGCPYSCAFCLSGRCGAVRFFDLDRAKADLVRLANSSAQTVKLVDRTFNANAKRAYALLAFLRDGCGVLFPAKVCFHLEIAGDILDDATIALIASLPPGLIQLEIGLQSCNETTLAAVRRRTDIEQLRRNVAQLVAARTAHIHLDLIAGLPHEDMASFACSFNDAYALAPDMLQLGFLKLIPGCEMYEHPTIYPCTFAPEPPYEVTETPWLTRDDFAVLHHCEDALERIYNSGRFRRTLAFLLERGWTPFALFCDFGAYAASHGASAPLSLDAYTRLIFTYFSAPLSEPERLRLRDVMVCDRLAANASGRLPEVLQVPDPALKQLRLRLNADPATAERPGIRRGLAILYTERRAVYADYDAPNAITGEYSLHFAATRTATAAAAEEERNPL